MNEMIEVTKYTPDPDRTWEDTPLPDAKFDCPNCDEVKYPDQLFWLMLSATDDTTDDWYCGPCFFRLTNGKPLGISLSESLRTKR